jgi:hypothetical protein
MLCALASPAQPDAKAKRPAKAQRRPVVVDM